jgi:hypothetical protein
MIRVKLRRQPHKRHRMVMMGLAVWFVLAAGVFTWFSVQNGSYRSQFATYLQDVRTTVTAAPALLKQQKEANVPADTAENLRRFAATVSQKVKDGPTAPRLFGLSMGTDGERAKQVRLQAAADDFAADVKEVAAFVEYQDVIARNLQTLSLKDAHSHDQIVALAAAWQQSVEVIQKTQSPSKMAEVTATLTQKMSEAKMIIDQLATLYKANDEPGFTAKQKELTAVIAAFKPLGQQIVTVSTALDTELAQSYARLQKIF